MRRYRVQGIGAATWRVVLAVVIVLGLIGPTMGWAQVITPDAYEPDNSASVAGAIGLDGVVQPRTLFPSGDQDWVTFNAVAGTTYEILTSGTNGTETDTFLELYASDGTSLLAFNDDWEAMLTLYSRIEWTAPSNQTVFVRVYRYGNLLTGAYGLSVQPVVAVGPDAYEPDNTSATAGTIPVDGTVQARTIGPVGDHDWVSFNAVSGTTYEIRTGSDGKWTDTYLELFAADGTTLIDSNDDADASTYYSKITWTPASNQTVYAAVRHFDDGAGTGTYELSIKSIGPDAYEPDGTFAQASTIQANGAPQSHTLLPSGDHDWVSFAAVAGVQYEIVTYSSGGGATDTYLELYAPDGTTLIDSNDDATGNSVFSKIIWTAPASQTALAIVRHFDDGVGSGPYLVAVVGPNQAPVATGDSYSTPFNTALVVAAPGVLGNDTDADANPLTAVLVAGPAHGALTLNADGSLTYTPTSGYSGADSFTYKANDGTADSNTVTVSITVEAAPPVNQAPVATGDSYSTPFNTALVVAAPGVLGNDTDADANPLTAVLVAGPAHGALTLNADGSLTYTPTSGYSGADSFTYKANDGTADSNTVTVSITVEAAPAGVPVYRFYNVRNGTHFFTPSAAERDMIIATWPDVYRYEGIAYVMNPAKNTHALYRFYNRSTKSHFYTASEQEKNTILARWSNVFTLEGATYNVLLTPAPGSIPVYRFYHRNGSHFYTASSEERDMVIARWSNVYTYEGPGFWIAQ